MVVLDDFENGLGDWEGDAKLEIDQGAQPGSKALVWRCTDVPATIKYKFADRIPNRAQYTRIAVSTVVSGIFVTIAREGSRGTGRPSFSHRSIAAYTAAGASPPPTGSVGFRTIRNGSNGTHSSSSSPKTSGLQAGPAVERAWAADLLAAASDRGPT